jgi:tRNA pseudouridine32 synthase/23S rRNA pseudouridine746 synthase
MDNRHLFPFRTNISGIEIPAKLNNPFGGPLPELSRIAAQEFQQFIVSESQTWQEDFLAQKGKMFGVLVVQTSDQEYGYLGTVSGKLPGQVSCERFVPSVFDVSTGDFFINSGMTELTEIGSQIANTNDPAEITALTEQRRQKSIALQQRLFENYHFLNLSGEEKNLIEIFDASPQGTPSSGAGECAAPKLLQYAIQHRLRPIALAEFWWGNPARYKGRAHNVFYPACKDKCRPILEYMLEDTDLYLIGTQGGRKES